MFLVFEPSDLQALLALAVALIAIVLGVWQIIHQTRKTFADAVRKVDKQHVDVAALSARITELAQRLDDLEGK